MTDRITMEEGIADIAKSKLADLARAFIFKARPIIIMHNTSNDETVTLKLKRGLLRQKLYKQVGEGPEQEIASGVSAIFILGRALKEAMSLAKKGYIEI